MKKYRCKIDSPWMKKGSIVPYTFSPFKDGFMKFCEDFPDLFEEIPDRWVPKKNEKFFYMNCVLCVLEGTWEGHSIDVDLLEANNVFRTAEKAEAVLKKILQLLEYEKEV